MKKIILTVTLILCFILPVGAEVVDFASWTDLTPVQKDKLSKAQFNYKEQYNKIETSITDYTDKLNKVKKDTEKSPEQIAMVAGAYERNIKLLKSRQKQLETETDAVYKSILTEEQYNRLKSQQTKVQSSFDKFLEK